MVSGAAGSMAVVIVALVVQHGAQYLLASMYEHGLGVERDLRLARYWYAQCARAGDLAAPGKLREIDSKLAHEAGQ